MIEASNNTGQLKILNMKESIWSPNKSTNINLQKESANGQQKGGSKQSGVQEATE